LHKSSCRFLLPCFFSPFSLTDVSKTSHQDPFDEYKKRHEKKLARQAAEFQDASGNGRSNEKQKEDDVNWFGLKVGSGNAAFGTEEGGVGGVGKYLNLNSKRQRPPNGVPSVAPDESKKKRKLGFGNFENW
jgi:peptidyl-prolyl cis-trans isomerase-like protein 2